MRKMKVHIIGGNGQMGQWLKKFLESQGIVVTVSGREDATGEVKNADIVVVSVPISLAKNVIWRTGKIISEDQLLVDISSIKSESAKALKETGKPSLLLHHLFGPTISSLQNQKIIHYTIRQSPLIKQLLKLFEDSGAQLIEMGPQEHDKQMALVQCLTHFLNFSLAYSLMHNNVDLHGKISTPIFLNQLSVLSRVVDQVPKLVTEIQLANPEYPKIVSEFINHQQVLLKLIQKNDFNGLEKEFKIIHDSVKPKPTRIPNTLKSSTQTILPSQDLSISYLGPAGTFSHQALKLISRSKKHLQIPTPTLQQIFEKVSKGEVDLGIVPAENSTDGTIRETLDFLVDYDLKTVGAIELPVEQNILSKEKNLSSLKILYSHPQSIAQTRSWCNQNLVDVKIIPSSSNLSQVELEKDKSGVGFIGPAIAAQIYGLNILAKKIEDNPNNVTKFYLIAQSLNKINLQTKKTILFLSIFNRVGILRDILSIFADSNINLTKLESRPSKEKNWDYYFFVEVEVNYQDQKLLQALNILRQYCPKIIVLGGI